MAQNTPMRDQDKLVVSLAQLSPVWLNKAATIEKLCTAMQQAVSDGSNLVVFGEALLPGYPLKGNVCLVCA